MERECSRLMCPLQYNTMNTSDCQCADTCEWFTPKLILCSFCNTFQATQEISGKPVCGFCKTQIDMNNQLSKLRQEIDTGFKILEKQISYKL